MKMSENPLRPWVAVLVCFGIILGARAPVAAKVYIDIDSPGYRPLPIALFILPPDPGAGPCKNPKGVKTLVDVLKQDLETSGFFRILPSELYLVDPQSVPMYPGKIDFRAWSLIGAEALILLKISCEKEIIASEVQLLDVLTGNLLTWKRYRSLEPAIRRVAHKYANEVEKALTGVEGVFDTKIAYLSNATGKKELYLMDCDGYGSRQLTSLKSMNLSPSWSPDGRELAFTSYCKGHPEIYRMNLTGKAGMKPILRGFSPLCSGASWSPNGNQIAFSSSQGGRTNLFNISTQGGKPTQLTQGWSIDVSPSWSPDGKEIVFVSDRNGHPDLYVMQENGQDVRRLTFEGSYNADPEWSPMGDWIVYLSRVGGKFQIFRIRPDGTQQMQLTDIHCDHFNPTVSANGRLIAFSSNQQGSFDLYVMRMDGSGRKRLTWGPRDETEPAWSPRVDP
jgi:TolB protein